MMVAWGIPRPSFSQPIIPITPVITVTITGPSSSPTYDAGAATFINLIATVSGGTAPYQCAWSSDRGPAGSAPNAPNFTVPLSSGTNVITVSCSGKSGIGIDIITVTQGSVSSIWNENCTTTLVDGNQSTIQNYITNNVATFGTATVCVPAGSWTWTSNVGWTNKNIYLKGAGIGQTTITSGLTNALNIIVTSSSGDAVRIDGFTWVISNGNPGFISFGNASATSPSGTYTGGWRVSNNRFLTSNWNGTGVWITGLTAGLIDHNIWDLGGTGCIFPFKQQPFTNPDFDQRLSGEPMYNGMTAMNRSSDDSFTESTYFEFNTINCTASVPGPFLNDCLYGCKEVIRYNTINGGSMQTHSTRGADYGGLANSVYRNIVISNDRFFLLRSGTGRFFDNQVTGTATSIDLDSARFPGTACVVNATPSFTVSNTNPYDSTTEVSGWPGMNQPGRGGGLRGNVQPWEPIFSYKNGTASTCRTGGVCGEQTVISQNGGCGNMSTWLKTNSSPHINGEVDFINASNISEGTVLPPTCTKATMFRKTDEGPDVPTGFGSGKLGTFYLCTATNTWTSYYTPKGTHTSY